MKNKKTLQYVAGTLFALLGILSLIFSSSLTLWSIVFALGYLLIAVSLFASLPILTLVGGTVLVISTGRSLLLNVRHGYFIAFLMVELIAFALLAVAGLSPKTSKPLGILSAVFYILFRIMSQLGTIKASFTLQSVLFTVLFIAGAVLLGVAFSSNKGKAALATGTMFSGSGKIERLTRFKDLLDKGVLTQEEFEEKKRQILGQ